MATERQVLLDRVIDCGVVAVIRLDSARDPVALASALVRGGVCTVEFTMTTPNALGAIERIVAQMGEEVVVGAGTVLDVAGARRAFDAGAQLIVAPTVNPEVIELTRSHGALSVPGAQTPTEIELAMRSGADIVKLFPGRVATPGYFRDVLGPFPDAKLLPTGNVSLETAPEYIAAGAVAVGVGKALVDPAAAAAGRWEEIENNARAFRQVVTRAREGRS